LDLNQKVREQLIEQAIKVRSLSYSPYSHYVVAAALLTESGKVFTGVNIENSAYPTSICAERVAIFKAVSEGERAFKAIAVVTDNGGSPCGSCRQVMAEFSQQMQVITADVNGRIYLDVPLDNLLPHAFTPEDLE